jgi:type II secretory pathway pseudopilin PulG
MKTTSAFTLVEIALAMAVMAVGLAAVTSVYMTGLRWLSEGRSDWGALQAGRLALHNATLLRQEPNSPERASNQRYGDADGWLNGFYIVRKLDKDGETTDFRTHIKGGAFQPIRIQVYVGGNQTSGELVREFTATVHNREN